MHVNDCFFCKVDISKFEKTKNGRLIYPDIPLSIASVPYSEELHVPRPSTKDLESESDGEHFESESEESYVSHTDEENKNTFQTIRNFMM